MRPSVPSGAHTGAPSDIGRCLILCGDPASPASDRSGRCSCFRYTIGRPTWRAAVSTRRVRLHYSADRGDVDSRKIEHAARRAEVVLHVDYHDRGLGQVDGDRFWLRIDRDNAATRICHHTRSGDPYRTSPASESRRPPGSDAVTDLTVTGATRGALGASSGSRPRRDRQLLPIPPNSVRPHLLKRRTLPPPIPTPTAGPNPAK